MAGHNKWTQIKRQKAVTDGKKSKIFSKFSRLLTLESKRVAGNKNSPGLKAIIDQAKSFNMPNDNIERAIKKGVGGESGNLEKITYEAYGPEGAALVIEALTDNRNKAASEIKHILTNHAASLGAIGSALWAFTKSESGLEATTTVPLSLSGAESLVKLIDELEENDEVQEVFTNGEFPESFERK